MGIELALAGASLVGGIYSADQQRKAGNRAADAQTAAAQAGIDEQRRQFDALQKVLSPWVSAGGGALTGQQDLLGANGQAAQSAAIQALQDSPQFAALTQQGEDAILANASATGGLRGGNTQAALAQFRPQVLAQLIEQQYGRLAGLSSQGQNAAAGVGNAGMQTGVNVANLLGQQGAAQAGAALNAGRSSMGYANALTGALGQYAGLGGFGGSFTTPGVGGVYRNPEGDTYDYRGTVLPGALRGGM